MAKRPPQVTDAELTVLEILWDLGPRTARQITQRLYPQQTSSDAATVQKLLQRLESKGYIRRDRSSFAHIIEARMTRTAFAGQQLQGMAEKLSGGSIAPLLIHLVEREGLAKRERDEIRKLLDEHK